MILKWAARRFLGWLGDELDDWALDEVRAAARAHGATVTEVAPRTFKPPRVALACDPERRAALAARLDALGIEHAIATRDAPHDAPPDGR